jgi:hypothetical protein
MAFGVVGELFYELGHVTLDVHQQPLHHALLEEGGCPEPASESPESSTPCNWKLKLAQVTETQFLLSFLKILN